MAIPHDCFVVFPPPHSFFGKSGSDCTPNCFFFLGHDCAPLCFVGVQSKHFFFVFSFFGDMIVGAQSKRALFFFFSFLFFFFVFLFCFLFLEFLTASFMLHKC